MSDLELLWCMKFTLLEQFSSWEKARLTAKAT